MSSASTTSDESESDGDDDEAEDNVTSEIVDLLNKPNIDEHEFDEPVVPKEDLPSKNTRQMRSMGSNIF
jgi:hypothetical protein